MPTHGLQLFYALAKQSVFPFKLRDATQGGFEISLWRKRRSGDSRFLA